MEEERLTGPVGGYALAAVKAPATIGVLLGAEERRDGLKVWSIVVRTAREELVQEGSCPVEERGKRPVVEVRVLLPGLLITLVPVLGKIVTVEVALARVLHHAKEGAVEGEVVAVTKEVVITGEGSVALELIVAIQAWLGAGQRRINGGARSSIAADGELLGNRITISQGEAESCEQHCKVVADIIDVLLGIYKLGKCNDTVMR